MTTEIALYNDKIEDVRYGNLKYAASYCGSANANRGGRVGIFVKEGIKYTEVNDMIW